MGQGPSTSFVSAGLDAEHASDQQGVFGEIAALGRTPLPRPAFLGRVLRIIAKSFESPYAALHARQAVDAVEDSCHYGPTDPAFWKPSLQQFLTESLAEPGARARLLNPDRGSVRIAFLSAPICDEHDRIVGALALVTACTDREDMVRRLAILEALTRLASSVAGLDRVASSAPANGGAGFTSAAARACGYETPEALAFAITNNLRNKLNCEQVALGVVQGRRVRIVSISGLDHVTGCSEGVTRLRSAMEECLDAGRPLICQEAATWSGEAGTEGYRLHRQWHDTAGGDAVASIPLHDRGRIVAVISLRRRSGEAITEPLIEQIRTSVEPLVVAMMLLRRATRGVLRHTVEHARETLGTLLSPGHRRAKLATLAALAVVCWFAWGTAGYRVTVPCRVTASQLRQLSTPIEGLLLEARATEGDRILAGSVLCRFDSRDLEQQRDELLARIAVLEHEKDRAMAENKPVEVRLAEANQQLARTQLRITEGRIEQMTVRAPFDGVVVSGDLRKHIGARFQQGDPLFEIAPLTGWTLELEVPETDVDDVRADLTGSFAPSARPDERRSLRVTRVRPQAEVKDGRNIFVAEAATDLPFAWMRSAMEGTARIEAGRKRVWWIVLHRAVDYLRLNFWM